MICTRLLGGLGNQMFQWAFALALAERHGVGAAVDLTFLENRFPRPGFTFRSYELDVFAHPPSPCPIGATHRRVPSLRYVPPPVLETVALLGRLIAGQELVRHHGSAFCGAATRCGPSAYLDGYWQSEQYFEGAVARVREGFEFRRPLSETNAALADSLRGCDSVSVHVRRGDFISSGRTASFHGHCGPDYYRSVYEYFNARVRHPRYFLFSDDPDWTRANLSFFGRDLVVVSGNCGPDAWQDMQLMALCRHHAIANSSFSWWGAWLDPNPDKLVVAPSRWFADTATPDDDIVPRTWVRL